ncbi:DUF5701 family protein [Rhodococcus sp. X156]|uniref:DUF5701 family protein n=1 Tax=Rhodococcus sp. X156 TaxID=2499145 RepID=UPI000FDBD0A4|nr:DUF5701 family protein [Rhodococcus sp. X156]
MSVASPARTPSPTATAELDRQLDRLVDAGFPTLAGITEDRLRTLAAPLREHLPAEPFVLVTSRELLAPERLVELARLRTKTGFTTMAADDLARFVPTADVELPDAPLYLLVDVDAGEETRNVRPDDALSTILGTGRTPLTLEEGLAVAVQHPEWLRERTCFQMLGSRAGDKRVTGVWVSKGAPRLGWCWGGNPHTWLGMASAAARIG